MTPCLQLAGPALGCLPWSGVCWCRAVSHGRTHGGGTGETPFLLLGPGILEMIGCFLGCNGVSSLGPLCNGCPVGDARGGGTPELPPRRTQEQTQPDALPCLRKQARLRDARPVSALLPAPPPATISVPDKCCCDRSSEGEREALLTAGASRCSAGSGPQPRPHGARAGGRGVSLWGTQSHRYGRPHPERSRWPWGGGT